MTLMSRFGSQSPPTGWLLLQILNVKADSVIGITDLKSGSG
jgi:hypothetical protein